MAKTSAHSQAQLGVTSELCVPWRATLHTQLCPQLGLERDSALGGLQRPPTCSASRGPQSTRKLTRERAVPTLAGPHLSVWSERAWFQRGGPRCVFRCSTQPEEGLGAQRVSHPPGIRWRAHSPGQDWRVGPCTWPRSGKWWPKFKETISEEEKGKRVNPNLP